jgi:hypothetical protein
MTTPAVLPPLRPNLFDRLYLRGFRRRLARLLADRHPDLAPALQTRIEAEAARLTDANRHRVVDAASQSHLLLCALLVGTYRVLLEAPATRAAAFELVSEVYLQTGKSVPRPLMALFRLLARDPFRTMVSIARKKQAAYYGQSFAYEYEQDDDRAFRVTVRRCFYHSFLHDHGVLELGPVFCAKDNDWANLIDPPTMGFAFSRPTTLLGGDDGCRFEFRRVHLPVLNEGPQPS